MPPQNSLNFLFVGWLLSGTRDHFKLLDLSSSSSSSKRLVLEEGISSPCRCFRYKTENCIFLLKKNSKLPSKTIKLLYFLKVKKNLFMLKHYIIYMSLPSKKKIRSTILLKKIKHKKYMNFSTILLKKIETPKGMQSTKSFVTFSI